MTEHHTTPRPPCETDDTEALAKREKVRRLLIAPLELDGMVRDRKASAAAHAAFLAKLADRLGYMAPDNLERLRQICIAHALGAARNVWPGWVTIRNFAYRLQSPPDEANPIMQSWLHSRRGPELRLQGALVETYAWLRENRRQPTEFDERTIAREASDNAAVRRRLQRAVEAGTATEAEREWLVGYERLLATCNDIVDAGIAHRKALGEAS